MQRIVQTLLVLSLSFAVFAQDATVTRGSNIRAYRRAAAVTSTDVATSPTVSAMSTRAAWSTFTVTSLLTAF